MTNPLALIVEDDEDLTVIFSKALEAAGYGIEIEMEGDKAWSRLEAIEPALLVLDLHLPNLSGLDILHRLRATERLASVTVLAISADARMAEMASGEADLVLIKPITFSQLRELSSRFVPARSAPAESAPVESVPAESVPAESASAESASAESTSAESVPVKSVLAESASAESAPVKSVPAESAPVDEQKPAPPPPPEPRKTKARSGQAEKPDGSTR